MTAHSKAALSLPATNNPHPGSQSYDAQIWLQPIPEREIPVRARTETIHRDRKLGNGGWISF